MDVLGDGNRETITRKSAAEALGKIGNPAAVELLCFIVSHQEPLLKHAAIWSLCTIGDPNAIPVIEEELRSLQFNQHILEESLRELKGK